MKKYYTFFSDNVILKILNIQLFNIFKKLSADINDFIDSDTYIYDAISRETYDIT